MDKNKFLGLGKQLGLTRDKTHLGLALCGEMDGVPVFVAQYEVPVGRDPRPRPFTELRVERASTWRGGLCRAYPEHRGDTGDTPFDDRFAWFPHVDLPEASRPDYLASPHLRQSLIALDASIAAAIGHEGIAVFQVDHLDTATRMMILTHLPQASLLESALRLLVEIAGP
jgi:hypothetical protein